MSEEKIVLNSSELEKVDGGDFDDATMRPVTEEFKAAKKQVEAEIERMKKEQGGPLPVL